MLFWIFESYMRDIETIANDFTSIFFKPFSPFDMQKKQTSIGLGNLELYTQF